MSLKNSMKKSIIKKIKSLHLPEFFKTVLPNGITVILIEKHELPLISCEILFRGGSVLDPLGKEGLAAITLAMLRKGTQHLTAQEFANELDSMGATCATEEYMESCLISYESMRSHWKKGLDLLADMLQHPIFEQHEIDKMLQQEIDGCRQAKDNPNAVMQNYYESFLFAGHPYGRSESGSEVSLPQIYRDDIVLYYEQYYQPQHMIIAVAGAFSTNETLDDINRKFQHWQPTNTILPAVTPPQRPSQSKVLLIDKPEEEQGYFSIGSIGVAFSNPDYVGIDIVENILGGSFTSWLNEALRINSGLTYEVDAFTYRHHLPGPFTIASYVHIDSVQKAIELSLEQLDRLHHSGINDRMLTAGKNYIKGQFPSSMETIDQLAGLFCDLECYGAGPEMINSYFDKLDDLTVDYINDIARKYFPYKDIVFAVAGPADKLRKDVEKFGPVEEIKMSDPGFYNFE